MATCEISQSFEVSDNIDEKKVETALKRAIDADIRHIKSKGNELGVHRSGTLLKSLRAGRPSHKNGVYRISATFSGKREDGTSNSVVAFYNEFGVKHRLADGTLGKTQQARPFIAEGNAEAADEVAEILAEALQ